MIILPCEDIDTRTQMQATKDKTDVEPVAITHVADLIPPVPTATAPSAETGPVTGGEPGIAAAAAAAAVGATADAAPPAQVEAHKPGFFERIRQRLAKFRSRITRGIWGCKPAEEGTEKAAPAETHVPPGAPAAAVPAAGTKPALEVPPPPGEGGMGASSPISVLDAPVVVEKVAVVEVGVRTGRNSRTRSTHPHAAPFGQFTSWRW